MFCVRPYGLPGSSEVATSDAHPSISLLRPVGLLQCRSPGPDSHPSPRVYPGCSRVARVTAGHLQVTIPSVQCFNQLWNKVGLFFGDTALCVFAALGLLAS